MLKRASLAASQHRRNRESAIRLWRAAQLEIAGCSGSFPRPKNAALGESTCKKKGKKGHVRLVGRLQLASRSACELRTIFFFCFFSFPLLRCRGQSRVIRSWPACLQRDDFSHETHNCNCVNFFSFLGLDQRDLDMIASFTVLCCRFFFFFSCSFVSRYHHTSATRPTLFLRRATIILSQHHFAAACLHAVYCTYLSPAPTFNPEDGCPRFFFPQFLPCSSSLQIASPPLRPSASAPFRPSTKLTFSSAIPFASVCLLISFCSFLFLPLSSSCSPSLSRPSSRIALSDVPHPSSHHRSQAFSLSSRLITSIDRLSPSIHPRSSTCLLLDSSVNASHSHARRTLAASSSASSSRRRSSPLQTTTAVSAPTSCTPLPSEGLPTSPWPTVPRSPSWVSVPGR